MFTGLVEYIGKIINVTELDKAADGGQGWSLTIGDASSVLDDCKVGDSIAINGTCLTVTSFDSRSFKVNLAPETLRKTNLGKLTVGSPVNIERSVSGTTRFGGHFVQGHVDCTATIASITPEENTLWFKLRVDNPELMRYIVPKGFIAVDGTSLTVCEVVDQENTFTIMLIPHTQEHVIMPTKKLGDQVNIEVDMLGKYAEKAVTSVLHRDTMDESSPLFQMVQKMVQTCVQKH
ncbi:Riboflavin synthase alpha chain [Entomophthora muscae]|uniref:Riboflavin synthase alpha chain n=1 Tax=Entomophthora muscae TaxID=34485 RepID=A0ACC2SUE6_9FUNG|nr:Riboflavin synthase alpha chain [Entomophthora muscae]